MKLMTARVVNGHIDLPDEFLPEGSTVTVLLPEDPSEPELSESQRRELDQAVAEADRGEGVDGWQLLEELAG